MIVNWWFIDSFRWLMVAHERIMFSWRDEKTLTASEQIHWVGDISWFLPARLHENVNSLFTWLVYLQSSHSLCPCWMLTDTYASWVPCNWLTHHTFWNGSSNNCATARLTRSGLAKVADFGHAAQWGRVEDDWWMLDGYWWLHHGFVMII